MINKIIEFIKYGLKTRAVIFIVFLVTFGVILGAFQIFDRLELKRFWDHFADWPTAVLTLFVAISVFISGLREEWKQSRPKKLSVTFTFEGKEVMRCDKATLSSEGDIRALSQQIGKQMAGGNLKLKPILDTVSNRLAQDKNEIIMLYTVSMSLWGLEVKPDNHDGGDGRLKEVYRSGKKLVWSDPFSRETIEEECV